jgi:chemotaxis protein histidine kinase CheA
MNDEEKDDDPIGKALGLEPVEETTSKIEKILAEAHNDSAKNDFEYARANLYEIIEEGKDAMVKLAEISAQSQHPRSFEVYAKLIDTMLNANEKLLTLQTKIREISAADFPMSERAKTINNNLFVGSTAELQKVLKDMKNNGDA